VPLDAEVWGVSTIEQTQSLEPEHFVDATPTSATVSSDCSSCAHVKVPPGTDKHEAGTCISWVPENVNDDWNVLSALKVIVPDADDASTLVVSPVQPPD